MKGFDYLRREERQRYGELYVTEDAQMMRWSERLLDQGEQRGVQKGLDEAVQARLEQADEETLRRWGRNLLSAQSMDEVFRTK